MRGRFFGARASIWCLVLSLAMTAIPMAAFASGNVSYRFDSLVSKMWDFDKVGTISIDNAGNLLITDIQNSRIKKYSPDGVLLKQWGENGTGDGEFAGIADIAVDSRGYVYAVDENNHRVQVFDANGKYVNQIGGTEGCAVDKLYYPSGVAVDSADNIYISDSMNNRIMKYNSKLQFKKVWGSSDETVCGGSSDDIDKFNRPTGIAIGVDGKIYVADQLNHRVSIITQGAGGTDAFQTLGTGTMGSNSGQFSHPTDVFVDENQMYVADSGNHRIAKFEMTGDVPGAWPVEYWGALDATQKPVSGTALGAFNEPYSLAVVQAGQDKLVYVVEISNKRVQLLKTNGAGYAVWTKGQEKLVMPSDFVRNSAGHFIVADNDNIVELDDKGSYVKSWSAPSVKELALEASTENIWAIVGDTSIMKFDKDGNSLFVKTGFTLLEGISVDQYGNLFAIDSQAKKVYVMDKDGVVLYNWEPQLTPLGYLVDVAVDANGIAYVLNNGERKVQRYQVSYDAQNAPMNAEPIGDWADPDWDSTLALTLDADGNVWVCETTGGASGNRDKVSGYTPDGQRLFVFGERGSELHQFRVPYAVEVDASRNAYVLDNGNARIVKYAPVSADADLKELSVSAGTLSPVFTSEHITYNAHVDYFTSSVTVTGAVYDKMSTVSAQVNGQTKQPLPLSQGSVSLPVSLNVGNNIVNLEVTAQDGTTIKVYTVTINRASAPYIPPANPGNNDIPGDDVEPSNPPEEQGGGTNGDEQTPEFSDANSHWAKDAIAKAAKLGITSGYADGTFKPERQVTRGEFVAFLARAFAWNADGAQSNFADMDTMAPWVKPYAAIAANKGITSGYADGSFRPDKAITRAEAAVMAAKALGFASADASATSFADDKDIPSWARGYVHRMVSEGLLHGRGNNQFAPAANLTRAESVVLILLMMDQANKGM